MEARPDHILMFTNLKNNWKQKVKNLKILPSWAPNQIWDHINTNRKLKQLKFENEKHTIPEQFGKCRLRINENGSHDFSRSGKKIHRTRTVLHLYKNDTGRFVTPTRSKTYIQGDQTRTHCLFSPSFVFLKIRIWLKKFIRGTPKTCEGNKPFFLVSKMYKPSFFPKNVRMKHEKRILQLFYPTSQYLL